MDQQHLFPPDGIQRSAVFSEDRVYRYTLERVWDASKTRFLWVLLNPSTADETRDDPTNRRGMSFVREWGGGSCIFVNLFAFRSPDPRVMKAAADPIGPDNDHHILNQAELADVIVLAWGIHGTHLDRDQAIHDLLANFECFTMGTTKEGHPKHPLYLKNGTKLETA